MKFAQQLLSQFNPDWGLDSYVGYRDLKECIKDIEAADKGAERDEKVDAFYRMLNRDLQLVNLVLKHLEGGLLETMASLRQKPRTELRKEAIFECYSQGRAVKCYQELNHEAFKRIIKKFQKRMGLRAQRQPAREGDEDDIGAVQPLVPLEHRQLCDEFLALVDDAYFMSPEKLDITAELESMQQIYAEAFCEGATDIAEEVLEKVWAIDKRSHSRMVDYTDAHFYKQKQRKRERQFACRIFCGNTNRPLARNVSRCLGHQRGLGQAKVQAFVSGEVSIQIQENIRGDDVFIFQSGSHSVGEDDDDRISLSQAQMELLLLVHTARLSSASRITAVMPYMPYQHSNQPAASWAQMLKQMGCDRVLTVDLLAGQIQGFYEIPVDNVTVVLEFAKYFRDMLEEYFRDETGEPDWANRVVSVSPTSTGVERARTFADILGCGIATVIRRRTKDLQSQGFTGQLKFSEQAEIVGDVSNRVCIIVACILDEAELTESVAQQLVEAGACRVYVCAVHGVLPGDSCALLNDAPIEEIVVTDTICQDSHMRKCPKLRVVPVAPLLAECIDRIHREESVGSIMKQRPGMYGRPPTNTPARRASPYVWRDGMQGVRDEEVEKHLEGVDFRQLQQIVSERASPHAPSPHAPDQLSPRQCKAVRKAMKDGAELPYSLSLTSLGSN
eukprot:TRINITY_DN55370_c0_g1_i1.p1 TRINITY_DN55370_c0_g1~~TRINITY_DN55370_c0_g1_i1.p1  ORF type:complete len:672 (+),score=266.01 TRINITY_DN55370_c0_g1_i1:93-2108(+)